MIQTEDTVNNEVIRRAINNLYHKCPRERNDTAKHGQYPPTLCPEHQFSQHVVNGKRLITKRCSLPYATVFIFAHVINQIIA